MLNMSLHRWPCVNLRVTNKQHDVFSGGSAADCRTVRALPLKHGSDSSTLQCFLERVRGGCSINCAPQRSSHVSVEIKWHAGSSREGVLLEMCEGSCWCCWSNRLLCEMTWRRRGSAARVHHLQALITEPPGSGSGAGRLQEAAVRIRVRSCVDFLLRRCRGGPLSSSSRVATEL